MYNVVKKFKTTLKIKCFGLLTIYRKTGYFVGGINTKILRKIQKDEIIFLMHIYIMNSHIMMVKEV